MTPSVAVVIPVKNGFPEIKACINALLTQTIRVSRILVIDSGSTDGTIAYLKTIKEVELLEIDPASFNHGDTRNIGWKYCTEDFLFYTVQDAQAATHSMLEDLLKGFTDDEVDAVCGQQRVPHNINVNPVDWFRPQAEGTLQRYQFKIREQFDSLTPAEKSSICGWDDVIAMYRSSALKGTPFQRTVFGEDMIWAKEVIEKGHAIVYNRRAGIYHYHLENYAVTFKRNFTVMYFRYKLFGFIPPTPALSLRRRLSIIKWLAKSLSADIKGIWQWYHYNIENYKAVIQSHQQFIDAINDGEAALERKHELLCGIPPSPLKTI